MSDDPKQSKNNEKKNGDVKVPPRNWLIWLFIIGAIPLVLMLKKQGETKFPLMPRHELISLVDEDRIISGTIHYTPQATALYEITGRYKKDGSAEGVPFRTKTRLDPELEKKLLASKKFETLEPNTFWLNMF